MSLGPWGGGARGLPRRNGIKTPRRAQSPGVSVDKENSSALPTPPEMGPQLSFWVSARGGRGEPDRSLQMNMVTRWGNPCHKYVPSKCAPDPRVEDPSFSPSSNAPDNGV